MMADRITPMTHANFFCCAPTYSGVWLLTIKRPIISVGENLGLIKTRMMKSERNTVKTYLIGKKLFLNETNIAEMKVAKNSMPAAALISLSFKTAISDPSILSPNCMILFICYFFTTRNYTEHFLLPKGNNGDAETSPYSPGSSYSFYSALILFLPQLTPTEKHRSKNNGDGKNEQFHNSVFLFDIFI